MIYYLQKGQASEVKSRVEYLQRVFHTYFVRCEDEGDFLCLKSFPFQNDGICFVTGHDRQVYNLLSSGLHAEVVVLNCCFPKKFVEFTDKYRLYFCKVDSDGYARPRWASEYGTGFDILDSELMLLYSDKADALGKIKDAYTVLGGVK